jgi:hypothetical protein
MNILRYSSFIEVKIPIDQADALPFRGLLHCQDQVRLFGRGDELGLLSRTS